MDTIYEYYNLEALHEKKVVIYGCGKNAREFAIRLLNEEIQFDYFLFTGDEEEWELPMLYNKQIIGCSECKKLDNVLITAPFFLIQDAEKFLLEKGLINYFIKIENIRSKVKNAPQIIIYGTGSRAQRVYNGYKEVMNIEYFCDSDKNKEGGLFNGKKIIHPSKLNEFPNNTVIIIASTAYKSIMDVLKEYRFNTNYVFKEEYWLIIDDTKEKICAVKDYCIEDIIFDTRNNKVVAYGEKTQLESFIRKMDILGISIEKVIRRNSIEEDGSIFELMYYKENDIKYIITDKWSEPLVSAIQDMDIRKENVICVSGFYNNFKLDPVLFIDKEKEFLDPTLGCMIGSVDDKYFGFKKYKYIFNIGEKSPVKILILGGSTTTGYRMVNRSWAEYLSGILKENKISHIIYNGGREGFIATQELLRFIRDGLWLAPDIVINYSGFNNCSPSTSDISPFFDSYQTELFQALYEIKNKSVLKAESMEGVHYGIHVDEDIFLYWYKYMQIINMICEKSGIKHKVFLQPNLLSKNSYGKNDKDVLFAKHLFLWNNFNNNLQMFNFANDGIDKIDYSGSIKKCQYFRKKGNTVNEKWYCDLSGIFDNIDGMYMDLCHVYEQGNKIIAQRIFEEIQEFL